jgi:hypothetical protein
MTALTTTDRKGFAPATLTEAMDFSKMLADSQMVPRAYQGKPQDVLVCVQWGYEIGLAPMQALQNIAVINGKPSVYGDAAMALVQASPVCEDIEEYFEGEGTPNPVAVCVAKRKGRKPVVAKFSVEDAKRAGLWGKQGPWQAYPKRMMQMRARGFALRDAFPDVLKGLITAEEAQDYPDEAKPRPAKDITPRNPLDRVAAPALPEVTSDPIVIAQAMEDTVDPVLTALDEAKTIADQMVERFEVVNIPEVTVAEVTDVVAEEQQPDPVIAEANALAQEAVEELEELDATVVAAGYGLLVPGKEIPVSVHGSLDEWAEAYEAMADKIAKAGKRPARERMTILREFKECNDTTLKRIDTVKRLRHTASYSQRLKALGAAQ